MERFKNIYINRQSGEYYNTHYLSQVMFLYMRWQKYLDDDYAGREKSFFEYFTNLVERISPFFWVIVKDGTAAGFIYLENVAGDRNNLHNSEVNVCFDKACCCLTVTMLISA